MTHTPTKGDYALDSRGKKTAITSVIDKWKLTCAKDCDTVEFKDVVSPALAGLPPYLRLFPVKEQK